MSLKFRKVNIVEEKKHEASYKAGVRAYVDITLNDTMKINGFRVLDHDRGLWVSPPTQRTELKGKKYYFPIFEFVDSQYNADLERDIIAKYKKVVEGEPVTEKAEKIW